TPRQRYQLGDHLGTATLEIDEVGAIISYEEYHPYGTTAWWATASSTDVSAKRYRYTGKEKDEETGLAYHGARYLIAWLGRWEKPDPKPNPKWSRYEYCRCSPTNHVDVDGAEPQDVVGAAIWEAATWYPNAVMAAHAGLEQGAKAFAADPIGTVKAGLQKDVAVAKAGVAVGSAVAADPWKAASDATAFLISHGTVAGIRGQMNAAVQADDVAAGGAAGRDFGAMVTLGMAGEALGPVAAEAAGPALSRLAKFADDPFDMGSLVPKDLGSFSEVADDLRPKFREWNGVTTGDGQLAGPLLGVSPKGLVVSEGGVPVVGLFDVEAVVKDPTALWGLSSVEVATTFTGAGYAASVRQSTRGSGLAEIVMIEGHPEISQIQVHPGGGRHGGAYVKVSSSTQGVLKVVDPDTYVPTPGERAMIIPFQGY
ncbi:MAG: RHS repeat-associated core domain-containing protein, partial [Myxococcota bacterium]